MEQVITTERVPIKLWLNDLEEGALEQAKNVANLPFVVGHVSILSDSHQGYGVPIGCVFGAKNVIVPFAVGSDVSCGVACFRTNLTELSKEQLKQIMGGSKEYKGGIRGNIPVGFNHNKKQQGNMPDTVELHRGLTDEQSNELIITKEYQKATLQLSSLGSGNHFLEIQRGDDGFIWVMVHSGSRNLGYKVAEHYNKVAEELNDKYFSQVPRKHQLAFLPFDSEEGQMYFREMKYCMEFAKMNRKLMLQKTFECFKETVDCEINTPYGEDGILDINHNYASIENHFGQNLIVHRKGATLARKDTIGIIPGSQGTSSFVVIGKGNKESLETCSHGSGRTMSRKKAQETLSLEEEKKKLDELGIIHNIRNKKDLDEASSSYKDVEKVIELQKDLIDVLVRLTPLAVIKG